MGAESPVARNFQNEETTMRGVMKRVAMGSLAVSLVGLAGCATNGDIERLEAEMARVNSTAEQAAADAASAKSDAAAARSAAESAAQSAQETNEKLDRMFKKSMYK